MLTIDDFCKIYNVDKNNLYVSRSQGSLPGSIFYKSNFHNINYIHETFFLRREEFKRKVNQFNHSMFYLLTEYYSASNIAKNAALHTEGEESTLLIYLVDTMWCIDNKSMLNYKLSKTQWYLYRYNKWVANKLSKKFGKKFDLEKILDKRMVG